MSITDPVAVGGRLDRATIQGDARVIEDDPHGGWERLLPIWEAKEPAIVAFLKARVALPLFFERALIEITPRRALYWADGDAGDRAGQVTDVGEGGRVMATTTEPTATVAGHDRRTLDSATRPRPAVRLSLPHPLVRRRRRLSRSASRSRRRSTATGGTATFAAPAGLTVPTDVDVEPDRLAHPAAAGLRLRRAPPRHGLGPGAASRRRRPSRSAADRAWGWDEAEVPFFEYSERSVGQSQKYFDALSVERGTPVKPQLSFGWLALRTTRLPFLTRDDRAGRARHRDRRARRARSTC